MTLLAAVLATLADAVAHRAYIVTGQAVELNPLFAGADPLLALAAKVALCVLLVALVAVIGSRARWALRVAVVAGLIGLASTVGALG